VGDDPIGKNRLMELVRVHVRTCPYTGIFRSMMRLSLIAALPFLLATGCTHRGVSPETKNESWALIRMELDRSFLGNRGILPIFQAPQGNGVGVPKAKGGLRINDHGRVACIVEILEPVVGLGGKARYFNYDAIRFFGRISEDGTKFVLSDTSGGNARLGVPTILYVREVARDILRIQAATGDRMLPYVYYFGEGPATSPPIHIPYIDR